MIKSSGQYGQSADVSMELLVNGVSLSIGQMGRDFLLLRDTIDYPPGNARIVMRVDERERNWEVHLPDGMTASERRVSIAKPA